MDFIYKMAFNAKKCTNILKSIPVIGPASEITTIGILTACGQDTTNLVIDPANFNPLKNASDMIRHIKGATKEYSKGIWLGKRPLDNQVLALTVCPGIVDLYHYAIMISGLVYHVKSINRTIKKGKESKCKFYIEITNDSSVVNSFTWYPTDCANLKNRSSLKSFSKNYEAYQYRTKTNVNCYQIFIFDMISYAAGLDRNEAVQYVICVLGTIIF